MQSIKKFEQIVFNRDNYNSTEELFETVSKQLNILLNAGYLAVVRYDAADPSLGVVCIDFEHDETADSWGVYNPYWLTENEMDMIVCERENNSQEKLPTKEDN